MLLKQFLAIVLYSFYFLQVETLALSVGHGKAETDDSTPSIRNPQPCVDFASIACADDKRQGMMIFEDAISAADYQYNLAILNVMEKYKKGELVLNDNCQGFIEKASKYYETCNQANEKNLTKFLEEIRPGTLLNWPLLDDESAAGKPTRHWPYEKEFDFWGFLGELNSLGFNNVLVWQKIDVDKQGKIYVNLRPFYIDNSTFPSTSQLEHFITLLGLENSSKIISNLKETYKKFVDIADRNKNGNGKVLELYYEDIQALYPNLKLNSFLQQVTQSHLPNDTLIFITNFDYFEYLNKNFATVFEQLELVNYIMFKVLVYVTLNRHNGNTAIECVGALRSNFALAVNYLYEQHIFSPHEQIIGTEIEELLTAEIRILTKYIENNDFKLTPTQVKLLTEEISNVGFNIGNLPGATKCENIEKFYAKLTTLDEKSFYKNHILILKYNFKNTYGNDKNLRNLLKVTNELDHDAELIYKPENNMIVLPYTSLQEVIIEKSNHSLSKYSYLAFLLAHKLTHNFIGKVIDYYYSNQNVEFKYDFACWRNQMPSENIYLGFIETMAIEVCREISKHKFHNLQYTAPENFWNEEFFFNLSQFFCSRDYRKNRLNKLVMNMEEFSHVFNCSKESKMNTVEKCHVF